jgi:hypothetical protein
MALAVVVKLAARPLEQAALELADADPAPAIGSTDQRGVNELQRRPLVDSAEMTSPE